MSNFVSDAWDGATGGLTGGGWKDWAGTIGGAGLGGSMLAPITGLAGYALIDTPRLQKRMAEQIADEERRHIEGVLAQRNANLERLRSLFGKGTSADAMRNQRSIADAINQYYQAQLGTNLRSAEDQFAGASRVSRQNLARVGQLGSGLEASSKAGTLADFLRARQSAIANASNARNSLQGRLDSQQTSIEQALSSGSEANPDFSAYARNRDQSLAEAKNSIVPQAVGNLFKTAGDSYFNGRVQEAQGNQGLNAYGFSSSVNRGNIT